MDDNCWICGKRESMMYRCRYCGKTFCSEHRLPERHACEGLERGYTSSSGSAGGYGGTGYQGTTSSNGNINDMMKEMLKHTAKTAAKGAANDFVSRTRQQASTSPSMAIIVICAISFLLEVIPAYSMLFQLYPTEILSRPWTLVTHMFLHASFGHLFFNMFVLFFFGRELERRVGNNTFLYVFFVSGIVSALGFSLTTTSSIPMVGASGAIMGVFATLAVLAPDLPIYVYFFPMKIKYALILFIILDFILIGAPDMIAHTAHLSGVIVGLFMGMRIKNKQKRYKSGYSSHSRRW
ncbi:MAG: rhomboid family intramembrane serine protease [Euryarchaeota archaeon]|nr:rhomboid family intramembrane serine protease [Euryarchaeota archaeon]